MITHVLRRFSILFFVAKTAQVEPTRTLNVASNAIVHQLGHGWTQACQPPPSPELLTMQELPWQQPSPPELNSHHSHHSPKDQKNNQQTAWLFNKFQEQAVRKRFSLSKRRQIWGFVEAGVESGGLGLGTRNDTHFSNEGPSEPPCPSADRFGFLQRLKSKAVGWGLEQEMTHFLPMKGPLNHCLILVICPYICAPCIECVPWSANSRPHGWTTSSMVNCTTGP
eukprot:1161727-Pelagomonas_calceolata.AAC.21